MTINPSHANLLGKIKDKRFRRLVDIALRAVGRKLAATGLDWRDREVFDLLVTVYAPSEPDCKAALAAWNRRVQGEAWLSTRKDVCDCEAWDQALDACNKAGGKWDLDIVPGCLRGKLKPRLRRPEATLQRR